MMDKDIQILRWFGASIIVILVLNMLMVHRREDAIHEFRAYFQGALSCVSSNQVRAPTPPPIIRTFYEN
jgi:predicted GTPase